MINNQTTYGIEIETQIPSSLNLRIGSHGNGLPVVSVTSGTETYTAPSFNGEYWKADNDPSIRTQDGYVKCEFVSPILKGDEGIKQIVAFLAFIKSIGGKRPVRHGGQTQGGIHITIHAGSCVQSSSPARIVEFCESVCKLGYRLSPILFGQNAERRDLSGWCRVLSVSEQSSAIRTAKYAISEGSARVPSISIGKYALINFTKIRTQGTFEFRSFSTTLVTSKVLALLTTCLAICEQASKRKTSGWAIENLKSSDLFRFFWSRSARRSITKSFPTLKATSQLQFDWGFASCFHYDTLRSGGEAPVISPEGLSVAGALALIGTNQFAVHTRGTRI